MGRANLLRKKLGRRERALGRHREQLKSFRVKLDFLDKKHKNEGLSDEERLTAEVLTIKEETLLETIANAETNLKNMGWVE